MQQTTLHPQPVIPTRKTLSESLIAADLAETLSRAGRVMAYADHAAITPEHFVYGIVEDSTDSPAHGALKRAMVSARISWEDLRTRLAFLLSQDASDGTDVGLDFVAADLTPYPLDAALVELLGRTCHNGNEHPCTTLDLLRRVAGSDSRVGYLFGRIGLSLSHLAPHLDDAEPLSVRLVDLVAQPEARPPVWARHSLLGDLRRALARRPRRHLLLVGPAGVGKRSLVVALADYTDKLIVIKEQSLLEDPLATLRDARSAAADGLLFIPHLDRFFGGHRAEFAPNAGAMLGQILWDETVTVIGTATDLRFRERLASDPLIYDTCQTLDIPAATPDETVTILNMGIPHIEEAYHLRAERNLAGEVVRLLRRFPPAQPLPAAAVNLVHLTAADVAHGADAFSIMGDTIGVLDVSAVQQVIARHTGIPVGVMTGDDRARYATMTDTLREKIIGQDDAIDAVSRAVKSARAGLHDPRRPIGAFMLVGPTGVGKTALAKAVAEFMFGSDREILTLDMSEFMDAAAVTRLIGSPPGYIGYHEGGQLTNAVRQKPHQVILFDEIEKADVKVFDLLLQILDEGRLTSGSGEAVYFRDTLILMTSNIGQAAERDVVEQALRLHFRPEFLGRLDHIIHFNPLGDTDLLRILDLILDDEWRRLLASNLYLQVTDAAKAWLLARDFDRTRGARPLHQLVRDHLRHPLADLILTNPPTSSTDIVVDVDPETNNLVIAMDDHISDLYFEEA